MYNRIKTALERVIDMMGVIVALVMLLMLFNIFYDVVMRYLFNDVSIGMQELEWHLFSCVFLFGIGYSLKENAHVRVDIIYEKLGVKTQAIINIIGTLLLLMPFCALVLYYSIYFVAESYQLGEKSGDPGGLLYRWLIKATIPVSFGFTLLCALFVIFEQIDILRGKSIIHHNPPAV